VVAAPQLGSEDFVTASPEALGISAGERNAEVVARCQAKVAYAGLCVDTRVRDLASDEFVQFGRHLVGDGVPLRLSVAGSSHPAAADEYVAQHGLLLRWLNRRYVLREGERKRVCVIGRCFPSLRQIRFALQDEFVGAIIQATKL
jgi:hypothetical protein